MIEERVNQVIKGYELREPIGEGGYGVVYRAYQALVGRDVAVKIILPQYANHPDFIRRFEAEAQLVARLEHPYIVPLYDYWREPDGAFLVMRWLRGGSLYDLLTNGPLSTATIDRLLDQVGGALATAHRRGVVHRDLKPANILLDEDGNAYLADFGIAKDLGKKISPYQTDQTSVVGSPAYISPEQVKAEPITPQTDIYSLGVMLYEILTGELPFQAPTPIALMFKHINEQVPALRGHRPDLSEAVNAVIQKATAKNPADRYPDVLTMVNDLRQGLARRPAITTRLPELPQAPGRPENGGRTTGGSTTRSSYETGLIYLPTQVVEVETPIENPYKGLRPFQEADASDFFGREALTQLLLARMQEPGEFARFLAVVGPSGSGKSSVVRAGLVPAIRSGGLPGSENWFVLELYPGVRPIEELARSLLSIAVDPPNNLVAPLMLDDEGLLRVVDQVVPGADETEVVLVIDQFEELFTLVEDEAARNHFLNTLIKAVTDPYSRVRVIVTLRADFYDRPLLYSGFSELMRQRTEVVVPLRAEELKSAIVSPAERNGLRVDPELVEAILGDVGEQPGALPLLQYALTEVFERRTGRTLTLTPYHASGGVLGALARRAEEIYTTLSPEQQEAARQIFLRLVTLGEGVEDTRRRVRRTELAIVSYGEHKAHGENVRNSSLSVSAVPSVAEKAAMDSVIDIYSQYRLLTLDRDPATRAPTVEVAHEALIRTWGRLRQWLDDSRDDLRLQRRLSAASAEWAASGRERSFLASGARLEQLESWSQETQLALNAEEQAYLAASLAERDTQRAHEEARKAREAELEQRTRTFLRALAAVLAVAALVGIALSLFAFGQRQVALSNEHAAATSQALAQENADVAAAAQVRAENEAQRANRGAAEAQDLAVINGAWTEFYKGNLDLARELALVAADKPNPSLRAERTLADAAYSPGTRLILQGHDGVVTSVAYSPDEKWAISSGRDDNLLILWDLATGTPVRKLEGHTEAVRQVVFMPDGKRVLSASEDGTLKLWNVDTGAVIRSFKKHDGEVKGVALRPNSNQFLSAGADARLMLWNLDCTNVAPDTCDQPDKIFEKGNGGHTQEINQVTFTSDGKKALSSSQDTSLILWDVDTATPLKRFELPANGYEMRGVAILPGDQLALSSGESPDLLLWDLNTGQVVQTFKGHTQSVYDVAVSSDGKWALSGAVDNTVILWDIAKGRPIQILKGHGNYIREVTFSKDGRHALSASADGTIRLWDLVNGAEQQRLAAQAQALGVTFSPDGRYILSGSRGGPSRLWDAATGQLIHDFPWHERGSPAVAFSPDGQYILTGGDKHDGSVVLAMVETGEFVRNFTPRPWGVNMAAFTPDGKHALTGLIVPSAVEAKADNIDPAWQTIGMILWDVETGTPVQKFPDLKQSVNDLAITPDGTQVLVAVGSNLMLWDLNSGTLLKTLKGHKATINQLALSVDGRTAISGAADRTFIVWDVAAGTPVFTSEPQSAAVTAVALSRDGRYAAVSSEGAIFVWDLQTKQVLRDFLGHTNVVRELAFSADGRTLLSGSEDRTVRLWRLETLPEMIAWAKANRYSLELTCDQEQLYKLELKHCS